MGLTVSQQHAVDVRSRTLLISAAAGSGKTYTLTKRIIKAIIEEEVDLSRLLIVTFTRAAAGQLKEKIAKAISEAISEHPDNIHLQKQLINLGQAHISTIDSFFADPVKANFEKLGLPASIRMADEAELIPMRERIMKETLDSFFALCEPYGSSELSSVGYRTRYTELVSITSGARDTSGVFPAFWEIYKKLITSPIALEQLKKHAARLKEGSLGDPLVTLEGQTLKNELVSKVEYVRKTLLKCADDMVSDAFVCSKYQADFLDNSADCSALLDALETGDYPSIQNAFSNYSPRKITTIKKDDKTPESEYYQKLRTKLNASIKALNKEYLYLSKDELCGVLGEYSEMSLLLYNILSAFDKKYSEEKRQKGICEFSDMPKFMMRLLKDEDGTLSEYAISLSESFNEVYIDEYQDVNEIQDTIFSIIGRNRRFMVGDIKQSIYGFREAEPSIFADYRRKFPTYNKENDVLPTDEWGGNTIFMSENFRCDESVIKFTNLICSRVFSAFSESIGYTPDDDLKFGKLTPEGYIAPKVELNIIQTPPKYDDEDQTPTPPNDPLEDEAIAVANKIAELLRHGKNADGSPISARDIAILVHFHSHSSAIVDALGKLNIQCTLSAKGELFEGGDMRLLVDILSVIDNPRTDIPLYHVMTEQSDIYTPDFSLEDVIKIRRYSNDSSRSLYDAVLEYSISGDNDALRSRCAIFIAHIEKMRAEARGISADKLIKALIFSERYSLLTKTDAYTYLFNCACNFVKNNWSSLYSFLGYFKSLMENGESGAEPIAEDKDAVRIMSIHQSKGLEFNVCILFGFGKQFNIRDNSPLIFNKELGASMKLPPKKTGDALNDIRARYETNPIFKSVCRYNIQKQLEEEARVFYVALTRARERLIISATISKTYDEYLKKISDSADTVYEIKNSLTYLKWIILVLSKTAPEDYESFCTVNLYTKGCLELASPFTRAEREVAVGKNADAYEAELAQHLSYYKENKDARTILSVIPSKVAASKVSSRMLEENVFIPIPTGMLFSESDEDMDSISSDNEYRIRSRIELMRSVPKDFDSLLAVNQKPTAAEKGTAAHAFLQFCDFARVATDGIDAEIERLKRDKFITERTASILNRTQLKGFFKSEIFDFVSNAKKIRREFNFGMFRPASDFTQNDKISAIVHSKSIYVQGSIDLIIEDENGDIIICDYKTDRISADELADRTLLTEKIRSKHQNQLDQYSYAVTKIFGKAPKKRFVYLFNLKEAIEI